MANLTVLEDLVKSPGDRSFSPSRCNPNARCGNGLEKAYPTCAVRYGQLGYIGEFRYAPGMLFECGAKVVIQTNRGIEIGQQVSLTCTGCEKSVSRRQMQEYAKRSGQDCLRLRVGRILRVATAQDLEEERRINRDALVKLARARELAAQKQLPMKFIACEHLFGGERIIFQFMSEGRVDFRELVRELAHEYHTRIEMHQVGARDEARLVADYEICGRECCCKNFLKTLRPVTMRMAKLQKATLDPSKVSGRCGRLRCCLRYEHESYEALNKKLPKTGSRVRTATGIGTIRDRQVLTQLMIVEYDDGGGLETVPAEAVLEYNLPRASSGSERDQPAKPHPSGRREPASQRKAVHAMPAESSEDKSASRRPSREAAAAATKVGADSSGPLTPEGSDSEAAGRESSPTRRRRRRRGRRRSRRRSRGSERET